MMNGIKTIISDEIRPILLKHYGDIEVISFKDGVLYIKLLGQCNNCPSAKYAIQYVIEDKLKEKVPEIKKVVLHNETSDELLNFARGILQKNK